MVTIDNKDLLIRIDMLKSVLAEAAKEIEWWVGEHGCCEGHEDAILAKIKAYLDPPQLKPKWVRKGAP